LNWLDITPGSRWLFVFPHPDDELAVLAFLRRLRMLGAQVTSVWMHSTPFRKAESLRVLTKIGFPTKDLYFFEAPDGELCDQLDVYAPLLDDLIQAVQPDYVVTCAFEQGHLDHDATHFLVRRLAGSIPVLEFPLYYSYHAPKLQWMNQFSMFDADHYLPLDEHEIALKKRMARAYPSQNIWRTLCTYHVVCAILGRPARLAYRELLRPAAHYDYRQTVHQGIRGWLVQRTRHWTRWVDAVNRYEVQKFAPTSAIQTTAVTE